MSFLGIGGGKDDNGDDDGCTYVLGIPWHETAACRNRRKELKYGFKEDQNQINESSNVAENISRHGGTSGGGGDGSSTFDDILAGVNAAIGVSGEARGWAGRGDAPADDSSDGTSPLLIAGIVAGGAVLGLALLSRRAS